MKRLSKEQWTKFAWNLLKFTAPTLAVFFGQLASGIDHKVAGMVAVLALYGLLSDYFSKMQKS
jgi:hypothetical protein